MNATIIHIHNQRDLESAINQAHECFSSGGVVVFPTETVYGIAAQVGTSGVSKVYDGKKRPLDKPFAVHMPTYVAPMRRVLLES